MPFAVVSPRCEWNLIRQEYEDYALLEFVDHIYGLDPYDPARFLFSREVNVTLPVNNVANPAKVSHILLHECSHPPLPLYTHGDRITLLLSLFVAFYMLSHL